jgi:ABC-type lipoprotein export system ATPase subunit
MLKRLHRERGTTTLMVIHHTHILELADRIATLEEGSAQRATRRAAVAGGSFLASCR